ncbi:SMU1112c/YaeR family gloxylase I-like metalloprotein [Segetibacter aerophilus]|uniref:VOC family protein n=1 Tax=Segetibacter aerophilus TaxID=670293 RepID=A0A512B6T4_9BACT|nr:VOC family protein [Segetibacter aerophilus]GEO07670.1 VOC family protein [Segetibacter aerophilus]
MQIKGIHHIAILTDRYEESKKFYTDILGFSILNETYRKERDSYKLDLAIEGKYCIELFSFPDYKERNSFPESKGLRHLAFAVNDVAEWIVFLRSNNVQVQDVRIDEITNKKFTFFYDPNGQPLELYEG